MNDANLKAHFEVKKLLQDQAYSASGIMMQNARSLLESDTEVWTLKGGCKNCSGTERVLTWSTLDGSGYDEFGTCKECTEESKAAGSKPGVLGPVGSCGGNIQNTLDYAKSKYPKEMASSVEQYELTQSNLRCVTEPLTKQDYVIVTKGRKVPVGTHGVVVGFSSNDWGTKVGIVDSQGTIHWTATSNVERCLGMDNETKRPAIEEYIKSTNQFRKSKGLKPSAVTVAMLMSK